MSTCTSSNSGHGHWEASSPPQSSLRLLWLLRRQTGVCFWRAPRQPSSTRNFHWGGSAKAAAPPPDSCLSPGARRLQAGPDAPLLREDTRGRGTARRSFQERTKGPEDGQRGPRANRRASRRLPLTHSSCCEHCTGISWGKKCLKWPLGTTPETADTLAWAEGVERL